MKQHLCAHLVPREQSDSRDLAMPSIFSETENRSPLTVHPAASLHTDKKKALPIKEGLFKI